MLTVVGIVIKDCSEGMAVPKNHKFKNSNIGKVYYTKEKKLCNVVDVEYLPTGQAGM